MWQKFKNLYHLVAAVLANVYYGFPGKKLTVVGVTGTDGKTTTVNLIYEILRKAGKKVSLISTVGAKIGGKDYNLPFHVTTPSPWQLQKFLRNIVDEGNSFLVLEATSHALDQNRVWGIPFKVGVLTNITHEHLDYHKTYEKYVAAKARLFRNVKHAVINQEIVKLLNCFLVKDAKILTYGLEQGELNLKNFLFTTTLPGEYNKLNCLAAAGAAKVLEISDQAIRQGIEGFKGIEGRFENFPTGKNFKVIIDFAHTPNALESLLSTLRPQIKGKIIHVFGSAGLRDRGKRPMMGEIAGEYDDIIILTEEDYRTEDVEEIIHQIENGINSKNQVPSTKKISILRLQNRQEAIDKAISLAGKDDLVLLTGKGHERSLCRGKVEYPWSEQEAVKKALQR